MHRGGMVSPSRLVALVGLSLGAQASAIVLNWASAINGSASTAARWNPAQVPAASDDLVFNATAGTQAYIVTFDAAVPTTRSWVFNQDSVTLNQTASHTITNGIVIASATGNTATVNVTQGAWFSTWSSLTNTIIGNTSGAVGTLNITGPDANIVLSGTGASAYVGNSNGNGTLNITAGGRMDIARRIIVAGNGTSSLGSLTVSGVNNLPPIRSTLAVSGTSEASTFGSVGDAIVHVANGGIVDIADDLFVASAASSTSQIVLGGSGGGGGVYDATLDIGGDLLLANNATTSTAGVATATVNDRGSLFVAGTLHVGNDPNGGSATLNIDSGAHVRARTVIDGANGAINHVGGTLQIDGGSLTGQDPLVVSGNRTPTLQFTNNAAHTQTSSFPISVVVGDSSAGRLSIESGSNFSLMGTDRDIYVGKELGSDGIITIDGAGSRLSAVAPDSQLFIGRFGTGEVSVENGARLEATHVLVSSLSGSRNGLLITVGPAPSSIEVSTLVIGHPAGSGSGVVTLNPGGSLLATWPGTAVQVKAGGSISVSSAASLDASIGTISIDGGLMSVGGVVRAGASFHLNSGQLRSGSNPTGTPRVDARVVVYPGALLNVANDDLTIGNATVTNGFTMQLGAIGSVSNGRTLTVLDADTAQVTGIHLDSGTLVAPNGLEIIPEGALDGTGTIVTSRLAVPATPLTLTATGAQGLTIQGQLFGLVGEVEGTGITFVNNPDSSLTSGWTGGGTIDARTRFSNATQLICLDDCFLGSNALDGAVFEPGSEAHLGTHSLFFPDSDGVELPSLTDMNGGNLICVNGLLLSAGRVLQGNGLIQGSLNLFGGTIDPDAFNSSTNDFRGVGVLAHDNSPVTFLPGSTYLCELAGFDGSMQPVHDLFQTDGHAALAGTLHVSLIQGYVPAQCETFTVLSASSISGTFDHVILPPRGVITYTPTSVEVSLSGCLADVDDGSATGMLDCGVTIDDLIYFVTSFEAGEPATDIDDGSGTGTPDGGVTIDDLLYYLFRFEAGC